MIKATIWIVLVATAAVLIKHTFLGPGTYFICGWIGGVTAATGADLIRRL